MKRKKPILKKHFKSKKGFSLLELICAIMIMAIAVSATATGLAISYESITKNSLMNKASAKAQMYCDIVMLSSMIQRQSAQEILTYLKWHMLLNFKVNM